MVVSSRIKIVKVYSVNKAVVTETTVGTETEVTFSL